MTVRITYFTVSTVKFFVFGFQEYEWKGYDQKFRRKQQFNPETLKIQKQWLYETMF